MINSNSLIIAVIAGLIVFVSKEMIVKLIEKHYANLTKIEVKRSFYVILLLVFVLALGVGEISNWQVESEVIEEKAPIPQRSDAEVLAGAIDTLAKIGLEKLDDKRFEDSLKKANREKKWVYQFGTLKTKKEALRLYNGLKSIEGVCLFKDRRNTYRVILDEANSDEVSLKANLKFMQERLAGVNDEISIVDLWSFCKKKQSLTEMDALETEYGLVRCFECSK